LDTTFLENLRKNFPIFKDGYSVPENKTQRNYSGKNVPDPQKNTNFDFSRTFSLLYPRSVVVRAEPKCTDTASALALGRENDAALAAPTACLRLTKKSGFNCGGGR
jgi:hypothetical protein